jgi:hypothetical protein
MSAALTLSKYSIGVGDRFAHQAEAQLRACVMAAERGVEVIPVWNKSNREHNIIGSHPASVRTAAERAVAALGWSRPFHVDADHINLATVDRFLDASDFYTIDVADWIGKASDPAAVAAFAARHGELGAALRIPGIDEPLRIDRGEVARIASKYLAAVQEAGRIYRHIEARKGAGRFITEVSMDETDSPQTPVELLVILAALADERVPIQTIAPKFTGRFNKGVDYQGDIARFAAEFAADLAAIDYAVANYDLHGNLKLSVHSGSDKFSIYGAIHRALVRFDAGVHLKTAGTTWLEELIGLAEHGGEGLELARQIYGEAWAHRQELCAPYAAVIDIDAARLPAPDEVGGWPAQRFLAALRHDPRCPQFNPSFRQLLHVGFKVAARLGSRYLDLLDACQEAIARNVTGNLFERHIRPVFLGGAP